MRRSRPFRQPVQVVPGVPRVEPHAQTVAIVLFVCSAAMLVGIASFNWFSRGSSHVGLAGVQECGRVGCTTHRMWSDVSHVPSDFPLLFGYLGVLSIRRIDPDSRSTRASCCSSAQARRRSAAAR